MNHYKNLDNEPLVLVFDPYLNVFYVIERLSTEVKIHDLAAKTQSEAVKEAKTLGFENLPFYKINEPH
jgi:hypothetical protein